MNINQMLGFPSSGPAADWLMFLVMLGAIGIAITLVVIWMFVVRPKSRRRRKHHRRRHNRQHNPTLAQTGGLPPMRDPDQPPPGP